MMVSDGELLIKGRLMRMEALDEDRAGYVTIDLSAGITRMARPGEGICIDW